MNLVFVSSWWPFPANNGSKIRIYNLLRQLAQTHQVTLLAFAQDDEATPEQVEHLQSFCQHVEFFPLPQPQLTRIKSLQGYLSPWPRSLVYSYSEALAAALQEHIEAGHADVVIASQVDNLRYLNDIAARVPTILEEVELTIYYDGVRTAPTPAHRVRSQLTTSKLENALRMIFANNTAVTVVSQAEHDHVRRLARPETPVVIIPNGVATTDISAVAVQPQPYSLIYPGAITYQPNYDAVSYFIREVLPLIQQQAPQTTFTVTGSTGTVDISDLVALPGVHFTGYLESVDAAMSSSWATVVPLQIGGGTRLKVLHSLGLGTPVVSTSKGIEGLNIEPGTEILIADTPADMAAAILTLFAHPQQRADLAAAGRARVEREYTWEIIGQQLLELIEQVTRNHTHGQPSAAT